MLFTGTRGQWQSVARPATAIVPELGVASASTPAAYKEGLSTMIRHQLHLQVSNVSFPLRLDSVPFDIDLHLPSLSTQDLKVLQPCKQLSWLTINFHLGHMTSSARTILVQTAFARPTLPEQHQPEQRRPGQPRPASISIPWSSLFLGFRTFGVIFTR